MASSLTNETAQRKARLAALRAELGEAAPSLRNYEATTTGSDAPSTTAIREAVKEIENEVEQFATEAIEAEKARSNVEVDVTNLAPQKPNWDLKRPLEPKLAKLERATQTAIVELIRKRLKMSGEVEAMPNELPREGDDEDD